jgi:hypothetical protein
MLETQQKVKEGKERKARGIPPKISTDIELLTGMAGSFFSVRVTRI